MNDEPMITLTDPTLEGTKDPARRLQKLRERHLILDEHILELREKPALIRHEIRELEKGVPACG